MYTWLACNIIENPVETIWYYTKKRSYQDQVKIVTTAQVASR